MDRTELILTTGWKFHLGECEDAWYAGFNDHGFRTVLLPHDWSVEQPFSRENSSGTGYLSGGIGWYRLHFSLPEEYRGKKLRLHFDGVYKNSQVWVNSYYMGKHPYGYTGFTYDISDCAKFGAEENVVAVKVTHTDIADSRWFTGSGIYRKVTLVIEETLGVAEDGMYLMTQTADKELATVRIHQEFYNATAAEAKAKAETILTDASGNVVLQKEEIRVLAPQKTVTVEWDAEIKNPLLWSVETPNLYQLHTYLTLPDGERVLAAQCRVGIRKAEFDPDRGFFLNGEAMKLKGVCVHHDGGCLGAAMTKEVWHRRLMTLKSGGCNAVRCSHNPHMPELYDLCDELGFLMMDEAFDEWENAKNKWSKGHNVYPPKHQGYFEDFPEWHERDLKAMVRRDRHHPSVILWSIGNEIDYPNDPYVHLSFATMTGNNDANKPAAERQFDRLKPDMTRLVTIAKELSRMVKEEDESCPVTMALAFPELSTTLGVMDALDVAGYNYKEQFYEADHKNFATKPILGSENSHSYAAWKAVKDNDYISGQFLWTGIDYLGEAHGWPIHGSGAGILDLAGFEKSRFYRRKALWAKAAFVCVMTRPQGRGNEEWTPCHARWQYAEGENVTVMVYSNLPQVSLFVGETCVETKDAYNADGAFQFEVVYTGKILRAEGYDAEGRAVASDCLAPAGTQRVLKGTWYQDASSRRNEIGYLYQYELELQDEQGRRITFEQPLVQLQVYGDGELAGIENGDLADIRPYSETERQMKAGRLMAYIRRTGAGEIHVIAKAAKEGLRCEAVAE